MGIQERKERERKELKELIMQKAAELFRKHGFEKTSMRTIARAIEYSPGTIYLHFNDKDELLYEVSVRAFDLFFQYFSRVKDIQDPLERLKKLGEVYITFALEYPSYYDLMFIMNDPMRCLEDKDAWEEGNKNHKVLTDILKECKEVGHFQEYDLDPLSLMIWSQVHGIVSLKVRDRLDIYETDDPDRLLFDALEIFNDSMEKL